MKRLVLLLLLVGIATAAPPKRAVVTPRAKSSVAIPGRTPPKRATNPLRRLTKQRIVIRDYGYPTRAEVLTPYGWRDFRTVRRYSIPVSNVQRWWYSRSRQMLYFRSGRLVGISRR